MSQLPCERTAVLVNMFCKLSVMCGIQTNFELPDKKNIGLLTFDMEYISRGLENIVKDEPYQKSTTRYSVYIYLVLLFKRSTKYEAKITNFIYVHSTIFIFILSAQNIHSYIHTMYI